MVARANIAVADGEGTPVTHTFVPDGDIAVDVARFINRNASVPAASEVLTLSPRMSSSSVEDYSVPGKKVNPQVTELRLKYPATYVDGVSGLTLVDFVDEGIITTRRHPRSSEQRGENLRVMLSNALLQAVVTPSFDRGEKIW